MGSVTVTRPDTAAVRHEVTRLSIRQRAGTRTRHHQCQGACI